MQAKKSCCIKKENTIQDYVNKNTACKTQEVILLRPPVFRPQMGKSVPVWYNKDVNQLESLVKNNECDKGLENMTYETV